jgi:hypothetical protein
MQRTQDAFRTLNKNHVLGHTEISLEGKMRGPGDFGSSIGMDDTTVGPSMPSMREGQMPSMREGQYLAEGPSGNEAPSSNQDGTFTQDGTI